MTGRWILAALPLLLVAEASSPAGPIRYADLIEARRTLTDEARLLEQEASLAAAGEAYVVIVPGRAEVHLRIRGRTIRRCRVEGIQLPAGPLLPLEIFRVTQVGSGGPVLLPPAPGRNGPLLWNDPGDAAGASGDDPIATDESLLGVEAPSVYTVRTDRLLSLRVGPQARDDARALRIVTDAQTARSLYYSLRPGTPIIVDGRLPSDSPGLRNM